MTVYLLDTNILLDMLKNPQGPATQTFRQRSGDAQARLVTSVIVAGEMRYGAAKKGSAKLAERVGQMLDAIEVLPLPREADLHYGELRTDLERRGLPIGPNDMFLAAHALALEAVLVTDNVGEFERIRGCGWRTGWSRRWEKNRQRQHP